MRDKGTTIYRFKMMLSDMIYLNDSRLDCRLFPDKYLPGQIRIDGKLRIAHPEDIGGE